MKTREERLQVLRNFFEPRIEVLKANVSRLQDKYNDEILKLDELNQQYEFKASQINTFYDVVDEEARLAGILANPPQLFGD